MNSKKAKPTAAKKPTRSAAKKPKQPAALSGLPAPKFEFVGDLQDLSVNALTSVAGGARGTCFSSACGGTPNDRNSCGMSGNCWPTPTPKALSSLDSGEGSVSNEQAWQTATLETAGLNTRLDDQGAQTASLETAGLNTRSDDQSLYGASVDTSGLDAASMNTASLDAASLDAASLNQTSFTTASLDEGVDEGMNNATLENCSTCEVCEG